GGLAGRRTDAARNFGKIVGRVQIARGCPPLLTVDEIVPVRDLIVHGTAVVAVGNATVHAARRLHSRVRVGQRHHEFAPMLQAFFDRAIAAIVPLELHEAGDFAHRVADLYLTSGGEARPA